MTPKSKIVIVAEDEFMLRWMAVDMLIEAGFEVIEACHTKDALTTLQGQAPDVCVLFTDIHMPGIIDGLALAHHTQAHWSWIGLLVASGQARPRPSELPAGSRFLPKPYDPKRVVDHVQELCAAE